jgi:hypothetical protein
MFYLIRVLVSKVISLEITLGMDFNPAFINLVRHEVVLLNRVDGRPGQGLAAIEGLFGLQFTRPECDFLNLIPNG